MAWQRKRVWSSNGVLEIAEIEVKGTGTSYDDAYDDALVNLLHKLSPVELGTFRLVDAHQCDSIPPERLFVKERLLRLPFGYMLSLGVESTKRDPAAPVHLWEQVWCFRFVYVADGESGVEIPSGSFDDRPAS